MYSLDFATLARLLLAHRQSGRVYAQLPKGIQHHRKAQAQIVLFQGRAVSYHIFDVHGQLICTGDIARRHIEKQATLDWTIEENSIERFATPTPITDPNLRTQNTSPNLPAMRPHYTHTSPNIPAIRASQNTSPSLPAIRVSQNTAPSLPAVRLSQNTAPNLPAVRPQNTSPNLPAIRASQQSQINAIYTIIPKRLMHIDHDLCNRLSRRHRRIIVLIDNERSIGKIISLLYPHNIDAGLHEVVDVLRDLESFQLITLPRT